MTCLPGTPQIQNIVPTTYYGTTAAAAPAMGLVAAALIAVPGYIYLEWRARLCITQDRYAEYARLYFVL